MPDQERRSMQRATRNVAESEKPRPDRMREDARLVPRPPNPETNRVEGEEGERPSEEKG